MNGDDITPSGFTEARDVERYVTKKYRAKFRRRILLYCLATFLFTIVFLTPGLRGEWVKFFGGLGRVLSPWITYSWRLAFDGYYFIATLLFGHGIFGWIIYILNIILFIAIGWIGARIKDSIKDKVDEWAMKRLTR